MKRKAEYERRLHEAKPLEERLAAHRWTIAQEKAIPIETPISLILKIEENERKKKVKKRTKSLNFYNQDENKNRTSIYANIFKVSQELQPTRESLVEKDWVRGPNNEFITGSLLEK